jgi:hypothetical protein
MNISKHKRIILLLIAFGVAVIVLVGGRLAYPYVSKVMKIEANINNIIYDPCSLAALTNTYDKVFLSFSENNTVNLCDAFSKIGKQKPQWVELCGDGNLQTVINIQYSGGFVRSGVIVCGTNDDLCGVTEIESIPVRKITTRIYCYP